MARQYPLPHAYAFRSVAAHDVVQIAVRQLVQEEERSLPAGLQALDEGVLEGAVGRENVGLS